MYNIDFVFLHLYFFRRNYKVQKIDTIDELFAFDVIDEKFMFDQTLKHLFDVFDMLFSIHKIYDYIVQIYDDVKIESFRQNIIDEILKRCKNVNKIKK